MEPSSATLDIPAPLPPVAAPMPSALLAHEIAQLPDDQLLAVHRDFEVWCVQAHQAPGILWELGRLREHTFRAVGEGSGKELDLDRYDEWYDHLVLWHATAQTVVGAYRLGPTDRIAAARGVHGLYTRTLWRFDDAFLDAMGPAVELGRSFVRVESWRDPVALSVLWKGIGAWLVQQPQYRKLIGPVSIDRRYSDESIGLMAGHLLAHHAREDLAPFVQPVTPLRLDPAHLLAGRCILDERALSAAVAEREDRGIPVLLKQYLRMGAEVLSLNVDPDFMDVVDALIVVDLDRAEPKRLRRFMGDDGLASFMAGRPLAPKPALRLLA